MLWIRIVLQDKEDTCFAMAPELIAQMNVLRILTLAPNLIYRCLAVTTPTILQEVAAFHRIGPVLSNLAFNQFERLSNLPLSKDAGAFLDAGRLQSDSGWAQSDRSRKRIRRPQTGPAPSR